jgi:hypothetical protein
MSEIMGANSKTELTNHTFNPQPKWERRRTLLREANTILAADDRRRHRQADMLPMRKPSPALPEPPLKWRLLSELRSVLRKRGDTL